MTGQPAPARATPLRNPTIALNTHAETLLRITAEHGVITTTEAFRKTGTHPQTGTRDKKHLLALALIEEERITMRRGRGGTAVAMRPTRAGYERANTKPGPSEVNPRQQQDGERGRNGERSRENVEGIEAA